MARLHISRKLILVCGVLTCSALSLMAGCPGAADPNQGGGGGGGGSGGGTGGQLTVSIATLNSLVAADEPLNLQATVSGGQANVNYKWTITGADGTWKDDDKANAMFTFAAMSDCNDVPITVTVEVGDGQTTAKAQAATAASKTWCTYNQANTANKLLSNSLTKLAIGANNTIWIGTNLGLNRLRGNAWAGITFSDGGLGRLPSDFSRPDVKRPYINFVHETPEGIWVNACEPFISSPSNCAGLQKFNIELNDPRGGDRWVTYSADPNSTRAAWGPNYQVLTNNVVTSVAYRSGMLAIGTPDGVNYVRIFDNTKTGADFSGQSVNAIAEQNYFGDLLTWFGTGSGKGIFVQEKWGVPFVRLSGAEWGGTGTYNNNTVRTIAAAGTTMYVGLEAGTFLGAGGMAMAALVKNAEGKDEVQWKLFTSGIPNKTINKIVVDKNKTAWVATSAGLARFTPKSDGTADGTWESASFKSSAVMSKGGLASDNIVDLAYQESTDTLWIATYGTGLTRLRLGLLK